MLRAMNAPSYQWSCHVCNASNAAGSAQCATCGFPASASGRDIQAGVQARLSSVPVHSTERFVERKTWLATDAAAFLAAGVLGYMVSRGVESGSLPPAVGHFHHLPFLVFFLCAAFLLRRKLRNQAYPRAVYLALHLSGGWLFGVGWAIRLATK